MILLAILIFTINILVNYGLHLVNMYLNEEDASIKYNPDKILKCIYALLNFGYI